MNDSIWILRSRLVAVIAAATLWMGAANAQTTTWKATVNGNWNDLGNWTGGFPGMNSNVVFADGTATIFSTTNNIASPSPLLFNSLAVSTLPSGTTTVSIGGNPLSFQSLTIANGLGLTMSAGLGTSGSPINTLSKQNGNGTLTLTAPSFISTVNLNSGALIVNSTLTGSVFSSSSVGGLGGNGTITGNLSNNSGPTTAGTGVGQSTLSIGGNLTVNGTYNVRLFGTGYTNASSADISRYAVGGAASVGNGSIALDLGLLTATQVNTLRTNTLMSGSFRDYNVITTAGPVSGTPLNFTISNLGFFNAGEWSLLPSTASAVRLRFTPVPEPLGILGFCGVAGWMIWKRRSQNCGPTQA